MYFFNVIPIQFLAHILVIKLAKCGMFAILFAVLEVICSQSCSDSVMLCALSNELIVNIGLSRLKKGMLCCPSVFVLTILVCASIQDTFIYLPFLVGSYYFIIISRFCG